jgi:hypothetical protein
MPNEMSNLPGIPRDRATLEYSLASKDPNEIANALYSATRHDPDWKWVQGYCLTFLDSAYAQVRWVAATCLGDLATIHRRMDLDLVLPALQKAARDPLTAYAAEESLSNIKHFIKTQ